MAGGGGGGDGEPEFQIAPMIDVLLVLLIFFMSITTTQVLKVDKGITLPVAPNALKKEDSRSEAIVNVRWDEASKKASFNYNDQIYEDLTELTKGLIDARKMSEGKSTNPNFRVVIRGDRNTTAANISRVMNSVGEAGISEVTFSATNRDRE